MIANRLAAINAIGTITTTAMAVSGERNVNGTRSAIPCQPALPAINPRAPRRIGPPGSVQGGRGQTDGEPGQEKHKG